MIAVQRLVKDGTINDTEGQAVDREILAGSVDPQTLTSNGFTQTELQAVEQALENTSAHSDAPGLPAGRPRPVAPRPMNPVVALSAGG